MTKELEKEIAHLRSCVMKMAIAIRDIPILIKRLDELEKKVKQ
jgi:hypothetical protein